MKLACTCAVSAALLVACVDDTLEIEANAVAVNELALVDVPAALPDESTAPIGTIPGEFNVTSDGAATYRMPLEVPRGRNGLQPEIALTYDSNTRDGHLGMGFALSGVTSTIARCGKNLSAHGTLTPERWNADDRLCLDGAYLVARTGAYHANNTIYGTERDHFSKIVQIGAPATHFFLYEKSGRILRYGATAGCQSDCSGLVKAQNGVVAAWALVEVSDRFGNTIKTTYRNQVSTATTDYDLDGLADYTGAPETQELYPLSLSYVGTGGLERKVSFSYEARNDVTHGWQAGVRRSRTARLASISTSVGGAIVRSYGIEYGYSPSTGISRVNSVQECGADGVCKPATRFEWYDNDIPDDQAFGKAATGLSAPPEYFTTGLSNNGPGDRLIIPMLAGDFNGDGRTDLFYPKGMTSGGTSCPSQGSCPVSNGTWRLAAAAARLTPTTELNTGIVAAAPFQAAVVTWDNDAGNDVLLLDRSSTWKVLKNGVALQDTGIAKRTDFGVNTSQQYADRIKVGDFTGDGMTDIAACMPTAVGSSVWRWSFYRHSGANWLAEAPLPTSISSSDCRELNAVMDVDGDGALDLLIRPVNPDANGVYFWRAIRFVDAAPVALATTLPSASMRTIDVNGDGLSDAMAIGSGPPTLGATCTQTSQCTGRDGCVSGRCTSPAVQSVRLWVNRGGGSFIGGRYGSKAPIANDYAQYNSSLGRATVFDYDGDGSEDLLLDGEHSGFEGCWIESPVPGLPQCPPPRTTWEVLVNDSRGNFVAVDTGIPFDREVTPDDIRQPSYARPDAIDDNGDLLPDVVFIEDEQIRILRRNGIVPDLLKAVRDGSHRVTPAMPEWSTTFTASIQYRSSADGSSPVAPLVHVYSQALSGGTTPSCVYPTRCGNPMRMLVHVHSVDNGGAVAASGAIGPGNRYTHRYEDFRKDRRGRGALGFGQHVVVEQQTGNEILERYNNFSYDSTGKRYPYQGKLVTQTRTYASTSSFPGSRVERKTFTYAQQLGVLGSFSTYLDQVLTEAFEVPVGGNVGASSIVLSQRDEYDVDSYGTITSASRYVAGVLEQTSIFSDILNDQSAWLIGRPRTVTVTSFAGLTPVSRKADTQLSLTTGSPLTSTTDEGLSTSFSYDAYGNVVEAEVKVGSESRVTTTTYDSDGVFPIAETNALGHATLRVFERGRGVVQTLVDPNGRVKQFAYDSFGRIRREVIPGRADTLTTYGYASLGTVADSYVTTTAVTNGLGVSSTTVDRLRRKVKQTETAAFGDVANVDFVYDVHGRVRSQTRPYLTGEIPVAQNFFYDTAGRLRKVVRPWGATTTTDFFRHAVGTKVVEKDERGFYSSTLRNQLGQIVASRQLTNSAGELPQAGEMSFTYGAFGMATKSTDPNGTATTYEYDRYGRVTKVENPNIGARTSQYDGFGQLISATDAAGVIVTFGYDKLGRRLVRGGALPSTWSYDSAPNGIGQIASSAAEGVDEHFEYDAAGRLASSVRTFADGTKLFETTTRDGFGRVLDVESGDVAGAKLVLRHGYDANGTHIRTSDAVSGLVYWELGAADAAGHVLSETFGNSLATSYGYDREHDRVESVETPGIGAYFYGYDASGNLESRWDLLAGERQEMVHDGLQRITGVTFYPAVGNKRTVRSYEYDRVGNITYDQLQGVHSYDPVRPQLLLKTDKHASLYLYDANGSLVSRPSPLGTMAISYVPGIAVPTLLTTPSGSVALSYSADVERVVKTSAEGTTLYGFTGVERRSTTEGKVTRFPVQGGGRIVAVVTDTEGAREVVYHHPDHLGSTQYVTKSSGALRESVFFDPFGLAESEWDGGVTSVPGASAYVGFTGHRHDVETELIDMVGRMYDPVVGRFLTADPLVQAPFDSRSHNRYSYVWNNPLRLTDPSGFAAGDGAAPLAPEPGRGDDPSAAPAGRDSCDSDRTCGGGDEDGPGLMSDLVDYLAGVAYGFSQGAAPGGQILAAGLESVSPLDAPYMFRVGTSVGLVAGGVADIVAGVSMLVGASGGEVLSSGAVTPLAVPVAAGGSALVLNGAAAVGAGLHQALSTGSGSGAPPKSVAEQAADLVPSNGGKARVVIDTPEERLMVDLTGKSHGNVPTPHVKRAERNLSAPNQPQYNTAKAKTVAATQEDIDRVRRYLETKD